MTVARRAPEHGFTKIQFNGGAQKSARSGLFVYQAARRAPELGFTKNQAIGGAHGRTRNVERVVGWRQHGASLNPALRRFKPSGAPKEARETLSVLFVYQAARRAPEHGFTKNQAIGGAQGRTRNVERVVGRWQHGVPLNPVSRRSKPTGAPDPARETLSVLLCPSSTASPRTRFHEDPSQRGRGATAINSRERSRFVRKGLEGREAVAAKSKKPYMVFLILP
jgi:hypothetical protein